MGLNGVGFFVGLEFVDNIGVWVFATKHKACTHSKGFCPYQITRNIIANNLYILKTQSIVNRLKRFKPLLIEVWTGFAIGKKLFGRDLGVVGDKYIGDSMGVEILYKLQRPRNRLFVNIINKYALYIYKISLRHRIPCIKFLNIIYYFAIITKFIQRSSPYAMAR